MTHRGGAEFASANSVVEEDIELSIGASLGLGKAEESPHRAEEAATSPEEPEEPVY